MALFCTCGGSCGFGAGPEGFGATCPSPHPTPLDVLAVFAGRLAGPTRRDARSSCPLKAFDPADWDMDNDVDPGDAAVLVIRSGG